MDFEYLIHPPLPLSSILKIIKIHIRAPILFNRSLKVVKAKDHDSQKGGTKDEQGKLSYMENFDEAIYMQY